MKNKMRGIADPFTLGLILALVGTASITTVHNEDKQNVVQSAESSLSKSTVMALNEEENE